MNLDLQSEKQLEDYLFEQMTEEGTCPVTGESVDMAFRQVDTGAYGIIDLISVTDAVIDEESGKIHVPRQVNVYELKKGDLDASAFGQIARYKRCVDRFIACGKGKFFDGLVNYYLVGSNVSASNDICFLADSIDWLTVYTFKITLHSGIEFYESCGWYRTKEDFSKLEKFFDDACCELEPVEQIKGTGTDG